jgi:saccharopine dehydrogenase-like NADP-dependent oxidoreductase
MSRALIIGAGGVAGVVVHKCCQNSQVFEEICIASRTVSKCEALKAQVEAKGYKTKVTTAQVDADKTEELIALIENYKPALVINVALPYQDLTIMDACLATKVDYLDTANYEPLDTAKFEYKWQWAYRERFEKAGITAVLGCGFDPGVTGVFSAYALKHYFDDFIQLIFSMQMQVITVIRLQPILIRRLIFVRLLQTEAIMKTVNSMKQSRCQLREYIISRKSVKRICICFTTRKWNPWH